MSVLNLQGVPPTSIGDAFDLALGYIVPGTNTVNMVGYVITPSGQFSESTDIQDEQHLVQIASPFSSDRYGRFPKVSQGDWSGGERQLIFVAGNQYYSSQGVDTSLPGHLMCYGVYQQLTPPQPNTTAPSAIASPPGSGWIFFTAQDNDLQWWLEAWLGGSTFATSAALTTSGHPGQIIGSSQILTFSGTVELVSGVYLGVYNIGVDSAQISSEVAVVLTNLSNTDNTDQLGALAYFQGSLWYVNQSVSPNVLRQITPPFPAVPTTVYTSEVMDPWIAAMSPSASGLAFVTGRGVVYSFDGSTATQAGVLPAPISSIVTANGVTYILCSSLTQSGVFQPILYQLSGSTLAVLDDYTRIAPQFQAVGADIPGGMLDSDNEWLYLFYPGLPVKRYSLTTGAVQDVGWHSLLTASETGHIGATMGGGGFAELVTDGLFYTGQATQGGTANTNGVLITSWFDFGVPDLDKSFGQIEFTFNRPTDNTTINSLQVSFQCNSPSAAWTALQPTLAVNSNDVNFYLPSHTIGSRVRFQITLIAALAPDIQSYSVGATLARAWQVTVSCRRDQSDRQGNPGQDVNQLTSTQKLANIKNAYTVAGGNVVLYMPDPTIDEAAVAAGLGPCLGVSQCYAVLQDYKWTSAPGVSPAYRTGMAPQPDGIEGDCDLTLTEQLG